MLTRINDNLYVTMDKVVYFNWIEQERRCVFKIDGFPQHDFVLEGQNALDMRKALYWWLSGSSPIEAPIIERDDIAPKKKRGRPKKVVKGKRK